MFELNVCLASVKIDKHCLSGRIAKVLYLVVWQCSKISQMLLLINISNGMQVWYTIDIFLLSAGTFGFEQCSSVVFSHKKQSMWTQHMLQNGLRKKQIKLRERRSATRFTTLYYDNMALLKRTKSANGTLLKQHAIRATSQQWRPYSGIISVHIHTFGLPNNKYFELKNSRGYHPNSNYLLNQWSNS